MPKKVSVSKSAMILPERDYLRQLGFSYKKPAKKLIKADAEKQILFAKELEQLEDECCEKSITVYYDEGKIEQDALPRKGWFLKEQAAQIESSSPEKNRSYSMRPSSAEGKNNYDASQTP